MRIEEEEYNQTCGFDCTMTNPMLTRTKVVRWFTAPPYYAEKPEEGPFVHRQVAGKGGHEVFYPIPINKEDSNDEIKRKRDERLHMEEDHVDLMLQPSKRAKSAKLTALFHRYRVFEFFASSFFNFWDYFDHVTPVFFSLLVVFGNVMNGRGVRLRNYLDFSMDIEDDNPTFWRVIGETVLWTPIMCNLRACLRMACNEGATGYTNLERHHMYFTSRMEDSVVNMIQHAHDLVNRSSLTRSFVQQMVNFIPPSFGHGFYFDTAINAGGIFDADETWDSVRDTTKFICRFEGEHYENECQLYNSIFDRILPRYYEEAVKEALENPHKFMWIRGNAPMSMIKMAQPRHIFISGAQVFCSSVELTTYYVHGQFYFRLIEQSKRNASEQNTQTYNLSPKNAGVLFLLHAFFRSRFRFVPKDNMVNIFIYFTCGFFFRLWTYNFGDPVIGLNHGVGHSNVLPRFPLALHVYIFATSCLPHTCVHLQRHFRGVYCNRLGIRRYEYMFFSDLCVGIVWMLRTIEVMMDTPSEFFQVIVDPGQTWYIMNESKYYLMVTVCCANFVALLRFFFWHVFNYKDRPQGPERLSKINVEDFLGPCWRESERTNFRGDEGLQRGLVEVLYTFHRVAAKSMEGNFNFPYDFPMNEGDDFSIADLAVVFYAYLRSPISKVKYPANPQEVDVSLFQLLQDFNENYHPDREGFKFDPDADEFSLGRWAEFDDSPVYKTRKYQCGLIQEYLRALLI